MTGMTRWAVGGQGSTGSAVSAEIVQGARVNPVEVAQLLRPGVVDSDQFTTFSASGSGYTILEADGTASVSLLATEKTGVVRLGITGTDNAEVSIGGSINEGVCGVIATGNPFGFEARIRVSSVADNTCGIFLLLGEEGLAAANTQTDDTGALADKDYIGFRTLQADGDGLDIVYNTEGGGGETVHLESAQTLVADTWYKVGFFFDGSSTIRFFVDGVQVGTDLDISATNVPDGQELAFVAGAKVGSDNALNYDIDYRFFCQEFVDN